MKKTGLTIAVVGATGAVGKEMLAALESRRFPFAELRLFASERSVGKSLACAGKSWTCAKLAKGAFQGVDFAFFDASDEVSREWVKEARDAGAIVIDNSGTFRMHPEVTLAVPEVNGARLKDLGPGALVAGPNCTTAQLVVALKPLHDRYGLKRVIVSTYQSVSGAGAAAIEELRSQTGDVLAGREARAAKLKYPIAFNLIPQIGGFLSGADEGTTSEEKKVIEETRKILELPNLAVACTAIRVPTVACHAESVNAEFERAPDPAEARRLLEKFPGVEVIDLPEYPMNLHGAGRDPVYVGRIRKDPSHPNGLQFWVVADNLRKGAALNAIQIAEALLA
ncbi:MAG: aspartate-semialdehyde dehydrogenase [Bdellovibrionales bacterium]|nr:aspartate-semialdehyde dehydrogenase [Bdellovibrionales bacterium]